MPSTFILTILASLVMLYLLLITHYLCITILVVIVVVLPLFAVKQVFQNSIILNLDDPEEESIFDNFFLSMKTNFTEFFFFSLKAYMLIILCFLFPFSVTYYSILKFNLDGLYKSLQKFSLILRDFRSIVEELEKKKKSTYYSSLRFNLNLLYLIYILNFLIVFFFLLIFLVIYFMVFEDFISVTVRYWWYDFHILWRFIEFRLLFIDINYFWTLFLVSIPVLFIYLSSEGAAKEIIKDSAYIVFFFIKIIILSNIFYIFLPLSPLIINFLRYFFFYNCSLTQELIKIFFLFKKIIRTLDSSNIEDGSKELNYCYIIIVILYFLISLSSSAIWGIISSTPLEIFYTIFNDIKKNFGEEFHDELIKLFFILK